MILFNFYLNLGILMPSCLLACILENPEVILLSVAIFVI